jgi:hypothetical protein
VTALRVNTANFIVKGAENAQPCPVALLATNEAMTAQTAVHAANIQNMTEHEYLTASDLKSFYHFGCQLELWKSVHEGHISNARGRPSPISMAHINRGYKWENLLVKRLDEQNLILRLSSNTTFRSQVERDPRNHFYVINSSFKNRNLFQNEFIARRTTPIAFGTLKPDFIEVWKRVVNGRLSIEYHIIDAKASKSVQVVPSLVV